MRTSVECICSICNCEIDTEIDTDVHKTEATTNSHLQIRGIKHLRQISVCIIVEFDILLWMQDRHTLTPKLGKSRTVRYE